MKERQFLLEELKKTHDRTGMDALYEKYGGGCNYKLTHKREVQLQPVGSSQTTSEGGKGPRLTSPAKTHGIYKASSQEEYRKMYTPAGRFISFLGTESIEGCNESCPYRLHDHCHIRDSDPFLSLRPMKRLKEGVKVMVFFHPHCERSKTVARWLQDLDR